MLPSVQIWIPRHQVCINPRSLHFSSVAMRKVDPKTGLAAMPKGSLAKPSSRTSSTSSSAAPVPYTALRTPSTIAFEERIARSHILPIRNSGGYHNEEVAKLRRARAAEALKTVVRYWHFLDGRKIRTAVHTMLAGDTMEEIANKVLREDPPLSTTAIEKRAQDDDMCMPPMPTTMESRSSSSTGMSEDLADLEEDDDDDMHMPPLPPLVPESSAPLSTSNAEIRPWKRLKMVASSEVVDLTMEDDDAATGESGSWQMRTAIQMLR